MGFERLALYLGVAALIAGIGFIALIVILAH